MTIFPDRIRSRLASAIHRYRQFRGNVDGLIGNALVGWVVPNDPALGPLKVGVFTSHGLIAEGTANVFRGDLMQAGIGSGHNGFSVPLDAIALQTILSLGGRVQVRTLGKPSFKIGQYQFERPANQPHMSASGASNAAAPGTLQQLLFGSLQQVQSLLASGPVDVSVQRPALAGHERLFATDDYINGGTLPDLMTGYSEFVRYRYKLDQTYDTHNDPTEVAHFLNWYLAGYSTIRAGLRVPMSKAMIDYFNTPIVIPGQRVSLTRASWASMMNVHPLLHSMNFNNPDWVVWVVYWWSIDQAKAMHVEDCLVPQAYVDLLAEVPEAWQDKAFGPSTFMLRIHAQTPELKSLDLNSEDDRRQLAQALVMMSVQRPDYLRYLPEATLAAVLDAPSDAESLFSAFTRQMAQQPTPAISRADFAAILRQKGFDLASRSYLFFTPEGHRLEAAAIPAVGSDDVVDLQLIGPFEKASGLGQATRLSASIIDQIGADSDAAGAKPAITVNCVNFGLDNPAPEGFSNVGALAGYKRAKVNLIHLNAESIPLNFAYQPDVFSGAYNIGYFFWELDTPAACHYLGMNMLDEIWVSTEYGVQIYQPESKGPVVNVGMCYEDQPDISGPDSRAYVQDLFGFDDSNFVFLVAFDSFSFVQRKNPVGTLKAFIAAFPDRPDVRLVVKTQNRRKVSDPVQHKIWAEVDALIKDDKRIVVLDKTLSYDDLLRLKKGCDAYVSLHKSEGWGFGMIEAMNLGVPVICTAYSGNMDFCSDQTAWLVDYSEIPLTQDDYIFVRDGQKWAEPDVTDAARQMRLVHDDAAGRAAKVNAALLNVRQNFSAQAIAKRYETRLRAILGSL